MIHIYFDSIWKAHFFWLNDILRWAFYIFAHCSSRGPLLIKWRSTEQTKHNADTFYQLNCASHRWYYFIFSSNRQLFRWKNSLKKKKKIYARLEHSSTIGITKKHSKQSPSLMVWLEWNFFLTIQKSIDRSLVSVLGTWGKESRIYNELELNGFSKSKMISTAIQ